MKILKHKNIMQVIYGVLLLMPFLAILGRTAYVVVNKNAYQSYSGYNIETNTELATNIESGLNYQFSISNYSGSLTMDSTIKTDNLVITTTNTQLKAFYDSNYQNIKYFTLRTNNNILYGYYYDENLTQIDYWGMSNAYYYNFTFTAQNNSAMTNNDIIYKVYQQQVGNSLDNVFEYSVSQFTEDNNFGRLDLSSWFTDMFLDDNAHNNLYVNFVNWYLNYAMLVSLMHFLFLVLMWFVNYSRRLLERGMNYDW